MTVNEKSGDLPAPVEDINETTRELIIDNYLNRTHLVQRVIDLLADEDLDLSDQAGRSHFEKDALVAWHRHALGSRRYQAQGKTKGQLAADIAAEHDVQMDEDRDGFTKAALIRVYVTLATGDETNDVATSADGKEGNEPDVPTLADGGVRR